MNIKQDEVKQKSVGFLPGLLFPDVVWTLTPAVGGTFE